LSLTDKVILERHGAVTELRLNREELANAIDVEMAFGIAAAIDEYAADDGARVLVVTGSGERSFCAGGELAVVTVPKPLFRSPIGRTLRWRRLGVQSGCEISQW
jgi:enoyl-CoA hydratase